MRYHRGISLNSSARLMVFPQRTTLRPRRCKDVLKVTGGRRRQDHVRPLGRRDDSGSGTSKFSRDPQKHEARKTINWL